MAGTRRVGLFLTAGLFLHAGAGLPFDQVAPGTVHVVFYRIEGEHQFLFVYRMPERRLVALEIDRREADPDGTDAEEAGELVHHLPIARLAGRIQYLPADRLPVPRRDLLRFLGRTRVRFQGVTLAAPGASKPGQWLGLAPDLSRP